MEKKIHILAEFYGCDKELLEKVNPLEKIFLELPKHADITVLHTKFHQFEPFGVTGFLLLAESHISIHTWPEYGCLALDVFTCGDEAEAKKAFDFLVKELKPEKISRKDTYRFED